MLLSLPTILLFFYIIFFLLLYPSQILLFLYVYSYCTPIIIQINNEFSPAIFLLLPTLPHSPLVLTSYFLYLSPSLSISPSLYSCSLSLPSILPTLLISSLLSLPFYASLPPFIYTFQHISIKQGHKDEKKMKSQIWFPLQNLHLKLTNSRPMY